VNRNTILFVAVVLLLLAGPLLWILTDVQPAAAPPVAAPPRTSARTEPPAPSARAVAAAARTADEAARASRPAPRAPSARIGVLVRVTLEGTDVAPPADTYVKVRMLPNPGIRRDPPPEPIELREGPEPSFDVDATDVFAGFVPGLELEVAIDRAGFVPARARQRVSQLVSTEGRPAVVPVQVALVLAGEATGIVQDDRHQPVAHAAVGSFALTPGKLTPVDETSTDDEGRFRVRLRPGEAHAVVAAAAGLRPSSAQALGVAGAAAPVTGLVLYDGYTIGGRVRIGIRNGARPGLRVIAFPAGDGLPFQLGAEYYSYRSGLVLRRPATAAVMDDGTFVVTGLAPDEHVLTLDCPEMLAEVADATAVNATPPATGVELVLTASWSAVKVRGPHGPLVRASVALRPAESEADKRRTWWDENTPPSVVGETDAEGTAHFLAPDERSFWVQVTADGHVGARKLATSPFTETLELRELPDTVLELKLEPVTEGEAIGPIPGKIDVRIFDLTDPRRSPPPVAVRQAELGAGGTFVLRGLSIGPPWGPFHVEIRAKPVGWYLLATVDVKLAYAKTTQAVAKIVRGGRVHVDIVDAAGARVAGTYSVLDAAGVEHAAGSVSAAARESADALVPSGTYRVVVTPADGASQTVPATVEVAKTVRAAVTAGAPR
jgi:hypothetical protein